MAEKSIISSTFYSVYSTVAETTHTTHEEYSGNKRIILSFISAYPIADVK